MKRDSEELVADNTQSLLLWTWLISSLIFVSVIIIVVISISTTSFTQSTPHLSHQPQIAEAVALAQLLNKVSPITPHHHAIAVSPSSAHNPRPPIIREEAKMEQGLGAAREGIRKASLIDHIIISNRSTVYHNPNAFYKSYAEMEKRLKVYVYEEGELPVVHNGPCKDIYSSEGVFIHEMEYGTHKFRTKDPHSAYVFFMPFSVAWMVKYMYKPNSFDLTPLKQFVADYVRIISSKHPFWNRTSGADHFMVSCHDWGPHASRGNPVLYNTSIRVLCNANFSEGFNPEKDVSLPEIKLLGNYISPKLKSPPPANTSRPYLAFFAGGRHGPVRPILLEHWKGRDPDIQVHEYLKKGVKKDYFSFILGSKFCLCPSGYEVASPRIIEAIYGECVPVILSKYYVLPFSDVLNWDEFSIKVEITEIPRLKEILMAVPDEKYLRLQEGLRSVKKHFSLNEPSKKFDMFHMILHSVWLRRLNFRVG